MSKKRRRLSIVLIIAALCIVVGAVNSEQVITSGKSLYAKLKVFNAVLNTIQSVYVDETDPRTLIDNAIKGMISELDPHTSYLTSEQYKEWRKSYEGYSGIGISFDIVNGKITVMSVMEDGPSYKIGLMPGDRIVAIDGKSAIGIKREEVPKRLMGPPGTKVRVMVERGGWEKPRQFEIIREEIKVSSVRQAFMITPEVGYIRIVRFSSTTGKELEQALEKLESMGMKKLLLDLRGNGGGYLGMAVEVADKFIPKGKLIVYQKGRIPSSYREYYATQDTHPFFPLVVMIDHGSASASEIVAGAIQDWDRGFIVGQTSFGKGLVQRSYTFQDGSALFITTAKYYTPTGRLIQREYSNITKEEYYHEAYNDTLRARVAAKDRPIFKTPLGRTVYGGGGITPDVILESSWKPISQELRRLVYADQRFFYTFTENYAKDHPEIKKNVQTFVDSFTVTDTIFEAFKQTVMKSGFKFSDKDFATNEEDIKFIIKRELAYVLWGEDAEFKVLMTRDTQLQKALTYFRQAEELLAHASVLKGK